MNQLEVIQLWASAMSFAPLRQIAATIRGVLLC
jgi:hypothetical protein